MSVPQTEMILHSIRLHTHTYHNFELILYRKYTHTFILYVRTIRATSKGFIKVVVVIVYVCAIMEALN